MREEEEKILLEFQDGLRAQRRSGGKVDEPLAERAVGILGRIASHWCRRRSISPERREGFVAWFPGWFLDDRGFSFLDAHDCEGGMSLGSWIWTYGCLNAYRDYVRRPLPAPPVPPEPALPPDPDPEPVVQLVRRMRAAASEPSGRRSYALLILKAFDWFAHAMDDPWLRGVLDFSFERRAAEELTKRPFEELALEISRTSGGGWNGTLSWEQLVWLTDPELKLTRESARTRVCRFRSELENARDNREVDHE
ncbi:MAG: hypothetical protein HY720_02370 [Planctomycetes bacterium]|nr:hypothetical protein [Planctomycetota bacterium]